MKRLNPDSLLNGLSSATEVMAHENVLIGWRKSPTTG
jgi:hypothetical protein